MSRQNERAFKFYFKYKMVNIEFTGKVIKVVPCGSKWDKLHILLWKKESIELAAKMRNDTLAQNNADYRYPIYVRGVKNTLGRAISITNDAQQICCKFMVRRSNIAAFMPIQTYEDENVTVRFQMRPYSLKDGFDGREVRGTLFEASAIRVHN